MKLIIRSLVNIIYSFLVISPVILAQPSGGPYGPVQQDYELPEITGSIYYASPDGKTEADGKTVNNPTTIEAAFSKVKTGDAVILRGGIYRTGNLILNKGITIQPFRDEKPVLKGVLIASDWKDQGNNLWTTHWDYLFPSKPDDWWQRNREGKKTPLYKFNNDMVFADGKFLQAKGWEGEVDENSYYIDYDKKLVYIGINPKDKLIEITAYNSALVRTTKDINGSKSDGKGPVIKGITFTQYAYRALEIEGKDPEGLSPEAEHGKEVTGTILENCEISFCSRVAGYLRGDKMTIKNCKVSDTSTEGIYIIGSSDVLLEKNIFTRNNIEEITGYYPAAVKIFNQCYRVTCNDNLIINLPSSNGIWYDVGNVDGVFTNNWVENVGSICETPNYDQPWPSQNGFFFEISKGAVCAGNLFINCDHGVWALNSCNVKFYNNTFINSMAVIARNGRSAAGDHFGWHPSTGPDVNERNGHVFVNNLLYAGGNFNRPLLFLQQPDSMCDKISGQQLKQIDNNVYINNSDKPFSIIVWSPAEGTNCRQFLNNPAEINKIHKEFSASSKALFNYTAPLFKSTLLHNFKLLADFKGAAALEPPAEIKKLAGSTMQYIGAYPVGN